MTPTRLWGSIRSVDPAELGAAAERIVTAGVDGIHVDIADGVFVPELTFGPAVARALAERTAVAVEAHLMVVDPERYFAELAQGGIARLCFHLEAAPYPWRVISHARSLGIAVGVAVNPATPIATLITVGASADFVNILTTEPDFAGEKILPGMLDRVSLARAGLPEHVRIEIDGGVTSDVVAAFADAGAQDIVVGRAITGTSAWADAVEGLRSSTEPEPGSAALLATRTYERSNSAR